MPDDYYVSQYSGEEIDALLGSAGAGTVRYDAAQTLTDEQKTQARGNIAAAPDGFGLGNGSVTLTESDDLDSVVGNGWYNWGLSTPANAPALIHIDAYPAYCSMFMIGSSQIVVSINQRNNMAMRSKNNKGWSPWEYINPPLALGVEYRTTERYLGKPVYTMAFSTGNLGATGEKISITKSTAQNGDALSPHYLVSCFGVIDQETGATNGRYVIPTMSYGGSTDDSGIIKVMMACSSTAGIALTVYAPARNLSSSSAVFTVKYTKTTDD